MDIDKLIEEKTQSFTGNGDYYFTYVTPEDCKKIVNEVLKQGQSLPIDIVMPCGDCSNKTSPCRTVNCQYSKVHKA